MEPGRPALTHLVDKQVVVGRLVAAGKLRAVRAALKSRRPDGDLTDAELGMRQRFDAARSFRSDDAELRQVLKTCGCDPDSLLAAGG